MAKIGISTQSDTERVARASTYSKTTSQAEKHGPVARAKTPGVQGAIITGGPRGVLKQTNVGDVNSTVDKLSKAGQESASKVRQAAKATSDQVTKQFQTQISGKGGKISSVS